MQSKAINSGRRVELRKDDRYIHIMKYMGSKRELLPDIKAAISELIPKGAGVLDLFAGTASVGVYLRDDYNILSNDIQQYSKVLSDALICTSSKKLKFKAEDKLGELRKYFEKNQSTLLESLKKTVKASDKFASTPKNKWSEAGREKYLEFIASFPAPGNNFKAGSADLKSLYKSYCERSTSSSSAFPYLQTTFLFSETYFSTRQCIDLDSIRYAVDQVFEDEIEKSIGLAALMYAHSYCSSGTGHFAMFRDLKDVKSINDVFLYRVRNVWSFFEKKFLEIIEFHRYLPKRKHQSLSMNFEDVLANKRLASKYELIYADPPYSFVHYSRFYHATESLVRYDYAMPQFKGRYRGDRHQSPFCQGQNVKAAFNKLIEAAAENNKILLLSYADTGMISLETIAQLVRDNGSKHTLTEVDYDHSTMGREGHKSNQIKELLITIHPPRSN